MPLSQAHNSDETIAVIGAGLMGTGIAHAIITSGRKASLVDTDSSALERAFSNIAKILDDGVKRGKVDDLEAQAAVKRLKTFNSLSDALDQSVSLLIETVSESLEAKIAVLSIADAELPDETILATNTSALSISEIAASTKRPDKVIGMHFFNPVHKMKLVEIVRGLSTSAETVETTKRWVDQLNKISIVVRESPGLTTSRMSALLGNEAMYMLSEGLASAEDIDAAMRGAFNHPMGPLELGDLTGWDTRLSVLQHLHKTLGEKYRPCPLILTMVKAGRFGRKTGHGIYRYEDGKRIANSGMATR
ncbi:3-hydroxyacyl-CoA dehydrogenase [Hyphococcus sp.]|uniref:3-hydroxyacyl-CoA dehydrogenase n=1 Tax=Hyphococcus sp. TaxID=2038636 RepID=UPI003CCC3640